MDPAKDRTQVEISWADYFDALLDERFRRFIDAQKAALDEPSTAQNKEAVHQVKLES